MNTKKRVVLLSGGMDSGTLLWRASAIDGPGAVIAMSVNYGQRHKKELLFASMLAEKLGVEHVTVDLSSLRTLFAGSSLTDDAIGVPEGHYAHESMKLTVVPMRNATFMCAATGLAWARGASEVYVAVHAGDHAIYPDCRPEFIDAFQRMARFSCDGFVSDVCIVAPFVNLTKAKIAQIGQDLQVPWQLTWSCYNGRDLHCGKCGTCMERREAFALAGIEDVTVYE